MAKFAGKPKGMKGKTRNYENGEAFVLDKESTLLNLVSTCLMGEPKFYGNPGDIEKKISELANEVDPKYLMQLSAYTRKELYLRSVPMFLLAHGAYRVDGKPYVREYAPKVINRADELYESVACYVNMYGKPLPNSLKKGVADSFEKFDEYQLAKYDRDTGMTLKDVMCLTHPRAPAELLQKIHDGTLETPVTWETQISKHGNKPEVWEALIDEQKLPYMATLRNLRNLLTSDGKGISDAHLDKVIRYLKNEKAVRYSKQFPFRFLSAYREVEKITHPRTAEVLDALDKAAYISYRNIPFLKGTTFISSDVSGSMDCPVSRNSMIRNVDIAMLMSCATHKYTDRAIVSVFGTEFKTLSVPKHTTGILSGLQRMYEAADTVGWATNGYLVIEYLNKKKIFVDRILVFTDMQLYDTKHGHSIRENTIRKEYEKYKQNINPDVKLYLFNLNGYGTVNFPENDRSVVNINGWSDRVLKFIQATEVDPKAQVNYIKKNY